ncbi:transcriptional regulator NrdR [archaeon CG10_big_fil_rev_8_21_14_0_10_43_11]|nr:MAG: transcriptional regulator NrdR [archaeon CG10_big_fil_rev_8_21_14_0_10_43_11]
MRCPYCTSDDLKVTDIRESANHVNRRRRECLQCGKRFTTYERVEDIKLRVVKKDGSRERFHRQKIVDGILKSCEKRPVSHEQVEHAVDELESELRQRGNNEITSSEIGELVVEKLRTIDRIAYIRFASVYRSFTDITQFENELKKLKEMNTNGYTGT